MSEASRGVKRLLWNIYPKLGRARRWLPLMLVLAEAWAGLQPAWREGGRRLEDGDGGRQHKQMFEARPFEVVMKRWARRGSPPLPAVSPRSVGTEALGCSASRRSRGNWPDFCHFCKTQSKAVRLVIHLPRMHQMKDAGRHKVSLRWWCCDVHHWEVFFNFKNSFLFPE